MASGGIHEVTVVLRTAGVGSSIGGIMKFAGALYILDKAVLSNIQAALDYEVVLKRMQAITGSSAESISSMSDSIRQMSATSIFSLNEVGRAQLEAVKMGYNITASYEVMNAAVDLAVAGEASLNDATMLVGRTLMQYNMHISEAGRVSDVFAMAANLSAADVEDFGKGMQYAGNVAKLFGYEVEDVAGWMAVLSNTGLEASMAGRSIRMFLTRLIKPTASASAEMKRFGIEVRDASGHLKKPPELINEVQRKLSGLTEAQRDETLAIIAGIRGVNAYAGAIAMGTDELERFTRILYDAEGEASRIHDEIEKSAKYQLTIVLHRWEAMINAALTYIELLEKIVTIERAMEVGVALAFMGGTQYDAILKSFNPPKDYKPGSGETRQSFLADDQFYVDKLAWEKALKSRESQANLDLGDYLKSQTSLQRKYQDLRLWMMQHGDELNPDWVKLNDQLKRYKREANTQTFEAMNIQYKLDHEKLTPRERAKFEKRLDELDKAADWRDILIFGAQMKQANTPQQTADVLQKQGEIDRIQQYLLRDSIRIDNVRNNILMDIANRWGAGFDVPDVSRYKTARDKERMSVGGEFLGDFISDSETTPWTNYKPSWQDGGVALPGGDVEGSGNTRSLGELMPGIRLIVTLKDGLEEWLEIQAERGASK